MNHYVTYTTIAMVLALAACSGSDEPSTVDVSEASAETPVEPAAAAADGLAYGDEIYVSDFWAGEYPNGLAVTQTSVVLQARAQMHVDSPQDVSCPLAQNANYHPWNFERAEADELRFRSVIQKTQISMTADHTVEADYDGAEAVVELNLSAGDTLTYLSYIGEGFILAEYDGREYVFNEEQLVNAAEFEEASVSPQQWVNVKCSDEAATRGWLLYTEALEHVGVTESPIAGYGVGFDLDHEEMANAQTP
ncbi:MAG: hypothetical protein ABJG15_06735 [Hyphomonadaceae bacterium]